MGSRTSGPTRLPAQTVRAIYAAAHGTQTGRAVAAYFSVSVKTVSQIKLRQTYQAETACGLAMCGASLFNYLQQQAQTRRERVA